MENDRSTAKELTPLELNNIKLDIKHTILTPQYLEDLIKNKNSESINDTQES